MKATLLQIATTRSRVIDVIAKVQSTRQEAKMPSAVSV